MAVLALLMADIDSLDVISHGISKGRLFLSKLVKFPSDDDDEDDRGFLLDLRSVCYKNQQRRMN